MSKYTTLRVITYRFALYKSFRNIILQINIEFRHRFKINVSKEDVLGVSVLQGNVSEEVHGEGSLQQQVDSDIDVNNFINTYRGLNHLSFAHLV